MQDESRKFEKYIVEIHINVIYRINKSQKVSLNEEYD